MVSEADPVCAGRARRHHAKPCHTVYPVILEQAARTSDAQRARAVENRRNPIRRMAVFGMPLMRRTLGTADNLAVAMEARCYSEKRTDPELKTERGTGCLSDRLPY